MDNVLTEKQIKILFEQYYIALVEFSWQIVKCREVALDIVQDTFVKMLEKAEELPPHEKAIKSYLYTAVRNTALNYIRHQKVQNEYHQINPWNEIDDTLILDAMIYAETIHNHRVPSEILSGSL